MVAPPSSKGLRSEIETRVGGVGLAGSSARIHRARSRGSSSASGPIRVFWRWTPPGTDHRAGFLMLAAPRIMPERRSVTATLTEVREYAMELIVPEGSSLAAMTAEKAGLRSLPGCFLVEIEREGEVLAAVGPEEVLRARDRLLFVGVVESIRDLANSRGLVLATDQIFKLDSPRLRRRLFEAVVSPASPLVGRTIREGRFRSIYNGAVIAVARNGERLRGKLGNIQLREGDLLLVEAAPDFASRMGQSRDFLLVSPLADSTPRRHSRAPIALGILIAMITLATLNTYPMLVAAMLAAGALVLSRRCTMTEARRSIDWSILIVIGAALGLGKAMEQIPDRTLAVPVTRGRVHAVRDCNHDARVGELRHAARESDESDGLRTGRLFVR